MEDWARAQNLFFRTWYLLQTALTHRSWSHERGWGDNNERLEFLGDSVLGLVVAEWVYQTCPFRPEGELARLKSALVSAENLARVAEQRELGALLLLGKGEENSGGRRKKNILADAVESVMGAYYLDAGWEAARTAILAWLSPQEFLSRDSGKDPKTALQELCHRLYHEIPRYELLETSGPDHRKHFRVQVVVRSRALAEGEGDSKKAAEQEAAERALRVLAKAGEGWPRGSS